MNPEASDFLSPVADASLILQQAVGWHIKLTFVLFGEMSRQLLAHFHKFCYRHSCQDDLWNLRWHSFLLHFFYPIFPYSWLLFWVHKCVHIDKYGTMQCTLSTQTVHFTIINTLLWNRIGWFKITFIFADDTDHPWVWSGDLWPSFFGFKVIGRLRLLLLITDHLFLI